jgi:hypothetical protein
MQNPTSILLISSASAAFFHALAPDHWMPFVAIAKAQKWHKFKLFWVTLISAIGHVGISIIVGIVGITLGFSLSKLHDIEGQRGEISLWLLIGFGIAYMLWGLKKARQQSREEIKKDKKKVIKVWTLIAIFILGPCEPLIPLLFLGYKYGYAGVISVSIIFSGITILMMLLQTLLAFKGAQLIKDNIAERYSHAFAGLVIALTGVLVMLLGI